MPEPSTTTQTAALASLGLDPTNLPELSQIDRDKMEPLMDTFDDSLDACCDDCHIKSHPEAPTRAKLVSGRMWHDFTRSLRTADGQPVYCDSCHKARLRFLDRSDRDALARWMRANYVDKLRLRDGSAVECSTCHGRPFEPRILEKLWQMGKG